MMKSASAVLKYESLARLAERAAMIVETEDFAAAVCNEVHKGKTNRHRIMAALGMAAHRLKEYRQMMSEFITSCEAAERDEAEEERKIPERAGNVIPFPGKYRAAVGGMRR